ncbi:hypothetical protein RJ639_020262 [Escallonia herrerae]|uniref:Reverse transcriptase Ty1/copia-type domain-containing protein n=1 Tax=Escallonia herrerae TaxID=1293975 RepID=A0AA88V4J9_9ASTE|nr:hypothetical protein RJ639_020262 [Escallonia herrerae]
MAQPLGFLHSSLPHHVCKLCKAIYGLKQAPRAWYQELKGYLLQAGFTKSVADASLFIYNKDAITAYFLIQLGEVPIVQQKAEMHCSKMLNAQKAETEVYSSPPETNLQSHDRGNTGVEELNWNTKHCYI